MKGMMAERSNAKRHQQMAHGGECAAKGSDSEVNEGGANEERIGWVCVGLERFEYVVLQHRDR